MAYHVDEGKAALEIGVLNDAFTTHSRLESFAWCAERDVRVLEMGAGGWRRNEHLPAAQLLEDTQARGRLIGELSDHGLRLGAINASGNPLHPNPTVGPDHDRRLRDAILLAASLDVDTVVTMAGCPGGPGTGEMAVFAPYPLNCDFENLATWQWEAVVQPYWQAMGAYLQRHAPDVSVCLELHPGAFAYNLTTFQMIRQAAGNQIRINLDPSHFFWQGIEPIRVIAEAAELIGWSHAKDCRIYPDRVALNGVLDFHYPPDPEHSTWTFAALGSGQPASYWHSFIAALRDIGYDKVLCIENEDPLHPGPPGIDLAIDTIRGLLGRTPRLDTRP